MKPERECPKIYRQYIDIFKRISIRGFSVFSYILEKIRPERDRFYFLIGECMQYTGYKSKKTIYAGLTELLCAGIIARGYVDTVYFINPLILFKGNRSMYLNEYRTNHIKY